MKAKLQAQLLDIQRQIAALRRKYAEARAARAKASFGWYAA